MPAAARSRALALFAQCGELALAFPIADIDRVALSADIAVAPVTSELFRVAIAGEPPIAGWDLAALFGKRASSRHTWVIIHASVHGAPRGFALACDRSLTVAPARLELALPGGLFSKRAGAIVGAFTMRDGEVPTGLLVAADRLLSDDDIAAAARAAGSGALVW